MASSARKKRRLSTDATSGLFVDGWLSEQLDSVVSELASRSPQDRPRLTGARAASNSDPAWLRETRG